ncbi:hypothetical protein H2203_007171 [Taxawa tesnikishii (nom. ined.)]|nr:hypothetical protein H2203_007171 [Dothideales sp. JES 119]
MDRPPRPPRLAHFNRRPRAYPPPPPSPSLRDIYHTTFLLRQKLCADLVPSILEHAQYWLAHTTTTTHPASVPSPSTSSISTATPSSSAQPTRQTFQPVTVRADNSPTTLLLTAPVNPRVRLAQPVRRVVFTIDSHDQGWCNAPDQGSWTWFEASIAPDCSAGGDGCGRDDIAGTMVVGNREVVRNAAGHGRSSRKVVVWPRERKDATGDGGGERDTTGSTQSGEGFTQPGAADEDEDEEKGRREEEAWVARLRRGDAIALQAFARFAGWENHIRSARIDIYTAAVV